MKKKFLYGIAVLAIAAIAAMNIELSNTQNKDLSDIMLKNLEALADYEVGPPLTNWKQYTIDCTVTVGFSYGVVYTHTYTYTTTACGYGTGSCLSPAGC